MNFKISIIVPCYNSEKYLDKCINSLINQTIGIENLELIFVNDASTDSTLSILKKYESKYPDNILVIDCPVNGKQGAARNIGMQYASSDYITFVDSDDYVDLTMYEKLYSIAEKYNCDRISCGMIVENIFGEPISKDELTIHNQLIFIDNIEKRKKLFRKRLNVGVCGSLYKKYVILENNIFFPEKITYEDNYWVSILDLYIKTSYCIPDLLYHYILHQGSTITNKNSTHHLDRLTIELMKIQKYKELGIFNILHDEIEINFLELFYLNTLHILFTRFSDVPYETIKFMQKKVLELFPNFKDNIYYKNKTVKFHPFLKTIDLNYTKNDWYILAESYIDTLKSKQK